MKHDVTPITLSGDMDEVGAGTGDVALSGNARDDYSLAVKITSAGVAGVGKFQYSLDYGLGADGASTWSRERVIPGGLTFVVPNSGMTLTFDTGPATYPLNALFTKTLLTNPPGITDLAGVAAEIPTNVLFPLWSVAGMLADETDASALAAAFQGHMETLTNTQRYCRGIIDIGSGDTATDVLGEALNWDAARVVACYGSVVRLSALPFEGYSYRKCSTQSGLAARAASILISTDVGRTADGPDGGVISIAFDGSENQLLDAAKISTMMTWSGISGFWFANANLKSGFGSDFRYLQHGRCMDVACRTTFEAEFPYIADSLRTVEAEDATEEHPVGSIDPLDAADVDASVSDALSDALLRPNNARGVPGHVSSVDFEIDFLHNLNTTDEIKSSVGIQPLGYPKKITTDLFFTLGT